MFMDIFAVQDIFRYSEDSADATPPPAVPSPVAPAPNPSPLKPAKLPKPPKAAPPPPPVYSRPSPLGFHTSTIKRALESQKSKRSTPEQLLAHLTDFAGTGYEKSPPKYTEKEPPPKDSGAKIGDTHPGWKKVNEKSEKLWYHPGKGEGPLVGLHSFLDGKPTVSHEDVIGYLDKHPHQINLEEHRTSDGRQTWSVVGNYDSERTYSSEDEAQQAADDLNDDHRREAEQEFEIEPIESEPVHRIKTSEIVDHFNNKAQNAAKDRAAAWGVKESEPGVFHAVPPETDPLHAMADSFATFGSEDAVRESIQKTLKREAKRNLPSTRHLEQDFDDPDEARDALREFLEQHAPDGIGDDLESDLDNLVEEHEDEVAGYRVTHPHESSSRFRRHFGDSFDTEDQAREAISDWLDMYHEAPYSVSQDENDEAGHRYEDYKLKGPHEDYDEVHIAIPGLKSPQVPLLDPKNYRVEEKPEPGTGRPFVYFVNKETGEEEGWVRADRIAEDGVTPQQALNNWANVENTMRHRTNSRGIKWNDGHGDYDSIDSPVVRIRHSTRESTDGKKLFFVDEMQGPRDREQKNMPEWVRSRIYDTGIKRAIQLAVKNGADRLAWTTGEQQISFYPNIRQVADKLEWEPNGEGSGKLLAYKDGKVVATKYIPEDELPAHIGGEVTKKLLASAQAPPPPKPPRVITVIGGYRVQDGDGEDVGGQFDDEAEAQEYLESHKDLLTKVSLKDRPRHVIEGDGLEVGGQGLKRLYDHDLPRRLQKILKKANPQIGKSTIQVGGQRNAGSVAAVGDEWKVFDGNQDVVASFPNFREARDYFELHSADLVSEPRDDVHSLELTPEIKALAQQGFNFYNRRGKPLRYGRDPMIAILQRLPMDQAVVYALGVLKLLQVRPDLQRAYDLKDLAYLRGLAEQAGKGSYARAPEDMFASQGGN
jgi:hypothetical protein